LLADWTYAMHSLNSSKTLLLLALLATMAASYMTSSLRQPWLIHARRGAANAPETSVLPRTIAQREYSSVWQRFKSKSEVQIRENVTKIKAIKVQRAKARGVFRTTYDRRMAELERRNIALAGVLKDYVGDRGDASSKTK
jgi:hypothetical protein